MFSKKLPLAPRLRAALFCVVGCAATVFNSAGISAQTKRFNDAGQLRGGAPTVTATLTDAFPDPNGDGRAAAGEEVTYTAVITNSGDISAANVSLTTAIDGNSTVVADSVQVESDLTPYAVRCTFYTGKGGGGGCGSPSAPYGVTDSNLNTIIGGQFDYLNVATSNVSYNDESGVFQFDAAVQDLIPNALGTLDGATADAAGIRLFLQNSRVTSGTGSIGINNADGTGTFTAAGQPYFQYSQILQQNEVTPARTVQVNVPNTVGSFTVDFLVSTKVQVMVVINEVLSNPGGTISDANGEWFELYNAGALPVNLKNFLVNDYSSADNSLGCEIGPNGTTNFCARPPFTVGSDVIIQSGGYAVLGNTTNTTNNGGVPVDYAYGSVLALANSLDGLRLRTPNALVIDKVFYASAAISSQNGISRELINPALNNINLDGSNWADALVSDVYGPGGRGTPKAQNSTFAPLGIPLTGKRSAAKSLAVENSAVENSAVEAVAPVVSRAGETITANLGTIAPGGSATVTYRVIIADPVPMGTLQIDDQATVSGDNFASIVTDDPTTPAANDATITPVGLAPTAAAVSISGRLVTPLEAGLTNALVILTDMQGNSRRVKTGRGGVFRFTEVTAGETYVISVSSKRYTYAAQFITVSEDLTDLILTPVE